MPLWLSESDVHHALAMSELIDAMQTALAAFSAGQVVQPVRTVLDSGPMAFFAVMPACDPASNLVGAKLVTVIPDNPLKGLPSHQAIIALFDAATGALLAVTDGRYITESRTAAVSAVSARHLARQDAHTLAIIGTGVQARSHLEALTLVREFREIRVWSPNRVKVRTFVAEAAREVRAATSAEEAVRGADVALHFQPGVRPDAEVIVALPLRQGRAGGGRVEEYAGEAYARPPFHVPVGGQRVFVVRIIQIEDVDVEPAV